MGRGPTANDVIDLVRAHGGTRDRSSPTVARLYSEAETPPLIRPRTVSAPAAGSSRSRASVRKAISDEHGQHVMALPKRSPARRPVADHGPFARPTGGMWNYGYLTRAR